MQQNKPAERPDGPRRFRKKPVVIEAIRWDGTDVDSILAFCLTKASVRRPYVRNESNQHYLLIETREGVMTAEKGDWIIKGVKGEFYPIKPDIFAETYQPADEPAPRDAACPVSARLAELMADYIKMKYRDKAFANELFKLVAWLEQQEAR